MATVIEELVSRLGFDIDDKNLKNFTASSDKLKKTLTRISVVATAAAAGITAWVSKIAIATDANIKFADSVGISFQALQELQFATEREGGSLQSLQSSLLALSQRAGEAFRGMGEGVEVFGLLGVEVTDFNGELKTADVLMGDIADQFQGFGKTQQIEFANKLGISPDLLLLLQKGSKNLDELRIKARSFGLVNEQTARNSEEFQDTLTDLNFTIRAIFTNIAGDLLPVVTDLGDQLRAWFTANKAIIKQNASKAVKSLTLAVKLLVKNAKILLTIISSILALKLIGFLGSFVIAIGTAITAIAGLNAGLTLTNVLMAGLPLLIGLAIAALIALVLVWEDLKVGFGGGESVLIEWADDSETARKALEVLFFALNRIKDLFINIVKIPYRLIKGVLDIIEIVELLGQALINTVKRPLDNIKNAIMEFPKAFSDAFTGMISKVADFGKSLTDAILGPIEKIIAGIKKVKSLLPGKNELEIITTPQGGIFVPNIPDPSDFQSSNDTQINAEININGANADPLEIGRAVETAINNVVRNGIENNPQLVVA